MANARGRLLPERGSRARSTRFASINKHQQRTEETRRKLLKAARRIFTRDGFEAARIEDISAEAGHTRGAFYANFERKEDLFFALLEQEIVERVQELQMLIEISERDALLSALRAYYVQKVADRQWVMLSLEFKLFALRHGKIRAKLAAAHRRIRSSINFDFMAGLVPAGERNAHAEETCKGILEATLSGMAIEHAYDPKRLGEKDAKDALARIFDTFVSNLPPLSGVIPRPARAPRSRSLSLPAPPTTP